MCKVSSGATEVDTELNIAVFLFITLPADWCIEKSAGMEEVKDPPFISTT